MPGRRRPHSIFGFRRGFLGGVNHFGLMRCVGLGISPYMQYALAFDAVTPQYWSGGTQYSPVSALPGYTYTRTGQVSFVNASGGIETFAPNVPPIVTGKGYMAYGALTNSFPYSQQFDNAAWSKNTVTVIADATIAPDGTNTADKVVMDGATNWHTIFSSALAAGTWSISVFAKAAEETVLAFSDFNADTAIATFDLVAGTVVISGSDASMTINSAEIIPLGDGFFRCAVVIATTAAKAPAFYLRQSTGFPGTAGNGLYLWQAQCLAGNFPDGGPIIPTTSAAASVGASALSNTANTITTDQDFFIWTIINQPARSVTGNKSVVRFGAQLWLGLDGADQLTAGDALAPGGSWVDAGFPQTAGGRCVVGLRRRAGKSCVFVKRVDGTQAQSSDVVVAWPVVTSALEIGQYAGSSQPNLPIEGVFAKTGTFSDADITAILQAA